MPLNEPVLVRIPLQATAYAIPQGHRLRLAVSNTYWPMAWPSPEPTTLTVHCGPRSTLALPRRRATELDETLKPFGAPETGTALATETTRLRQGGRNLRRNLHDGTTEVEFDWHGSGARILGTNTEMTEDNVTTYRIVEGDPLSAAVNCRVAVSLKRPGWKNEVRAESTMTCDAEHFLVTSTLDAFEDDGRVHARTFTHRFPRDGA
jgi:hypothetical protein